jgi:hypothetical protein
MSVAGCDSDQPAAATFFAVAFFPAFFLEATCALCNAQRLLVASAILRLPSALSVRFFVVECRELEEEGLPDVVPSPLTSRRAVMARVIASLCCSSSEMIRSTSFKNSPYSPVNSNSVFMITTLLEEKYLPEKQGGLADM